ncbi:hypothetical protein BDW72DRAFT_190261 [Aspergillus terricola var. indicus]
MDIPTLNFRDFTSGTQSQKDTFCSDLYTSLSTLGFVKIRNHTISDEILDQVFDWSKRFFALPLESKTLAVHPVQANPHRGWSCVGQEKLSVIRQGKAVFDLKESFDIGPENDPLYPNIFPNDSVIPGFRLFMKSFYAQCQALHLTLLSAIALSLNQDASFLSDRCGTNSSELRLNHYPSTKISDLQSGQKMRISSHTDFGTITLLWQDGVGGLEVEDQNHEGVYLPVGPTSTETSSGTDAECGSAREMIVNVGDCLQRWTNDRLRSANHRVTLPVEMKDMSTPGISEDIVPDRYSVAYFGKPDRGALVAAIPELVEEGEEVRYEGGMTAWEYNQSRLLQTY